MAYMWISLGISVCGFFASIGVTSFMSGMRWGMVKSDIEYLRRDVSSIMHYFKLTPADEQNGKRRR